MKLLPFFEERFDDNGKSQANYRHIRSVASKFITKLLKYGDEAFELCSKRADQTQRHADHVLLALARHNAAYLDSVNALLVTGCVESCPSLLRSILDATFGIAHVVQDKHEERALAYQLARIKRRIKHLRRGDRNHPDGRQLETDLTTDAFVPGILSKLPNGLAEKAAELERQLQAKPEFVPILAEWGRWKNPQWYTLFGGAKDIRGLAKQLNWQSLYDFFYRDWSNSAHAGDALDSYTTADNCLRPLRYPAGYAKVLSYAFMLYINGLEKVAGFYDAVMGSQVRDYAVKVLNPELVHTANQIEKALGAFK